MSKLVVIVGETASGKSALALDMAEQFNGEIVCADSRTIYRGMDIGTAKPTPEDRQRVPHHMLDVVEPSEAFTAARFKQLAVQAITDITARGKLPILVGGSGLYVDAVLFDYEFLPTPEPDERERLQAMDIPELQTEIIDRGLPMPLNALNKRHLTRVLETNGMMGAKHALRADTLVLGLSVDLETLRQRVAARTDAMLAGGFVAEVNTLVERYGQNAPGLLAPGYKAFLKYANGEYSLEQAREEFIRNDLQLAKRQRTWFKRNKSIHWLNDRSNAVEIITTFLNK